MQGRLLPAFFYGLEWPGPVPEAEAPGDPKNNVREWLPFVINVI